MDDNHSAASASPGIGRRGALKCLAWAGTGILWTVAGGVPRPLGQGLGGEALAAESSAFTFVQISDSHIGFKGEANPDPSATLQQTLTRVAALPVRPAMMIHTGDVTHLSKPAQFDQAGQILGGSGLDTHVLPGEHDVINDDGKQYFARFRHKDATDGGWYSFDQGGIHFIGLINVLGFTPATGGTLGTAQLDWLKQDLSARSSSTPIVVMAHLPLWPIYPQWGWTTDDAAEALGQMKRFGSVTVLNGHIHQVVQKVEGNLSYRTAMSTAFPQPPAGQGPGPGPMKVSADRLKTLLGLRRVTYEGAAAPSVTDLTLG